VEVQFQRDEQLYRRLFAEVMLFLRQNPTVRQWQIVVMYGDRTCAPRNDTAYTALLGLPQVHLVYLNELASTATESVELSLIRLIVEPAPTAIEQAQRLIERAQATPARLSTSVIIELIETIIVYKFPNLSWQEVEAMLGVSELRQTRVFQQALEEGREEGRRSEAQLLLRLLTRRLGQLPEARVDQVRSLPIETLEALGDALLDFSRLDDLEQWLTDYPQRQSEQE